VGFSQSLAGFFRRNRRVEKSGGEKGKKWRGEKGEAVTAGWEKQGRVPEESGRENLGRWVQDEKTG
jgi:hypothetical protein